jgi:hypothetical protein
MKRPILTRPKKKIVQKTDPKAERNAVQGEGDYRSAREFNAQEREFVRTHDTERLAEEATPDDANQAEEMERAEDAGKAHARPDPETQGRTDTRDTDGGVKQPPPLKPKR